MYTNYIQIHLAIDSRSFDSIITQLTKCFFSVQEWMNGVKMNLNPDKAELIIMSDKHTRESLLPKFPVPSFKAL